MNVALTGATGFVGGNLLRSLDRTKYHMKVLGRRVPDGHNCEFFKCEIDEYTIFNSVLNNVDVLIHCAARVHVMNDLSKNPIVEFRRTNVEGTINLAKQAAKAGVVRFIFLSSIQVNGEKTSNAKPFKSTDLHNPQDPYAASKAEAEEKLLHLGRETGMEIVIIRPPLIYGKGVKANFLSLMELVDKGIPLPFRAIRENKRSLVSVNNIVSLIQVCLEHPKAANQVFLVSDDNDLSISEIVSLMAKVQNRVNLSFPIPLWCFYFMGKLFNKSATVNRLVDPLRLDIEHTKTTLGWRPPSNVECGFKSVIDK
jgi:nucleoside-diphosphate-sugar epimerase